MFQSAGDILAHSFERAPYGYALLALAITAYVKLRPVMTQLAVAREESLLAARAHDNKEMNERVKRLEDLLEQKQLEHEKERQIHDRERQIDRHRLNNITQCFDALVMLLEMAPDRVSEALAKVKQMRAQQARNEAMEKGAAMQVVVSELVKKEETESGD